MGYLLCLGDLPRLHVLLYCMWKRQEPVCKAGLSSAHLKCLKCLNTITFCRNHQQYQICCAKYRNTSPIRQRHIGWITPLKYKNVSLIRHHAPFPKIGTVKSGWFPILLVRSPKANSCLRQRYGLKCWLLRFTYKALSLVRPVPYEWAIYSMWRYTIASH